MYKNINKNIEKNIGKKYVGQQIENLAAIYLIKQHLKILHKNFKCKFGEIDLICQDIMENQIIFIEVRYRKSIEFGEPAATVNKCKQRKLIKTAYYYLNKYFNELPVHYRFDIISCSGPLNFIKIDWLLNAFNGF